MGTRGQDSVYVHPVVTDYGDLLRMTAALHPLLGSSSVHDLTFSSPAPGPGEHGEIDVLPASGGFQPGNEAAAGSEGSAGAAPASGSGGSLPFTGFAPGITGLIGAGFTAAGTALRRVLKRT